MAEELRAPCGVDCSECDILKATQTDDDQIRAKCLDSWREIANEHWRIDLKLEDLNCKGCIQSGEVIFSPKYCPMANCAKKKGYSSCIRCSSWQTCDWLQGFLADNPEAQQYLESQMK